ncbi:MAG: glycine cleavage system protein H [Promethearchaeota archaeon]
MKDLVKVDDYEVEEGLYYHREHFWAKIEDGLVKFGATDYGQKALREVVFLELPEAGSVVEQDEPYGTVESVKAVIDLIAPLSGKIKEVHEELLDQPEMINEEPYGEGWLLTVEPSNLDDELKNLMDFDSAVAWYKKVVEES